MYFLCYQQRQKSKKTQKKTFQKFFVLKILSLPMYKLYLNKYVPAAGLRPLFFSKPQKSIACKQYIGLLSKPVQISTSTTAAQQQPTAQHIQRMIIIGLLCYVPCISILIRKNSSTAQLFPSALHINKTSWMKDPNHFENIAGEQHYREEISKNNIKLIVNLYLID